MSKTKKKDEVRVEKRPYFEVNVSGEYYTRGSGISFYKENIKVLEKTIKNLKDMSLLCYIRAIAIPKKLSMDPEKHPNYAGIRVSRIDGSVICHNGAIVSDSDFMMKTRKEIESYVNLLHIPIDTNRIKDDNKLREIISLYNDGNKESALDQYKKAVRSQEEDEEFFTLNKAYENTKESDTIDSLDSGL